MKLDGRFLDNIDHDSLSNVLGGDENGTYHLTAEQVEKLDNLDESGGAVAPEDIDHNSLDNLQGGDDTGRYHLTAGELTKVQRLRDNLEDDPASSSSGVMDGNIIILTFEDAFVGDEFEVEGGDGEFYYGTVPPTKTVTVSVKESNTSYNVGVKHNGTVYRTVATTNKNGGTKTVSMMASCTVVWRT